MDGLSLLPVPFTGNFGPGAFDAIERIPNLELDELEKRLRDLERNRNAPPK